MKMTNNETLKALECCVKNNAVCDNECPLFGDGKHLKKDCKLSLLKASLDLINRQNAEYNELKKQFDILNIECSRHEKAEDENTAEIERLAKLKKHIEIIERMMFAMANYTVDGNRVYPTLKVAKDTLEKQIPKKPDLEGDGYDENGNLIYDTGYCPNCRHIFEVDYDATRCCPVCGQALDWSDVK